MKTVAVISQKGGAGKTTLAVHLAVAALGHGLRTVIVDIDSQKSAVNWAARRSKFRNALEPEVFEGSPGTLAQVVAQAETVRYDLLLIDTAGKDDKDALAAARVADLLLIPSRLSILDVESVVTTYKLSAIVKRPAFVVLNACPTSGNQMLAQGSALVALSELGIKDAGAVLYQRKIYSTALNDGGTAQEHEPGGKAAQEVARLLTWLQDELGLKARRKRRAAA